MLNTQVTKDQAIAFAKRFYNDDNWERKVTITSVGSTGHIVSLNLVRHDDCDDEELYEEFPLEAGLDESRLQLVFKGIEFSYDVRFNPTLNRTVKEPYIGAYSLHVLDTFTGEMTTMKSDLAEAIMYRLKPSDLVVEFNEYLAKQNALNDLAEGAEYVVTFKLSPNIKGKQVSRPMSMRWNRKHEMFSSMSNSVNFADVLSITNPRTNTVMYSVH